MSSFRSYEVCAAFARLSREELVQALEQARELDDRETVDVILEHLQE